MNTSVKRDPEAILARIQREERGKLTVFLGAAAGVGKTYAMLLAAHERLAEGLDVVIGWVETHGRHETEALVNGLPVVDPNVMEYRGKVFREMNLDGILQRRPQLVLVDELAHTNIQGSRHPRRYYDVDELLDEGINVYTTLNIQHLESLNDIVAQITGVQVRETIPDQMLEKADQIHIIDIPAEELIQRLREGKVYAPEMASNALKKFFRPGNINALRELALRQAARSVNQQMETYRREQGIENPWPAGERILACVSSSQFGIHVLRRSRRMAANLGAEMVVAYVEKPKFYPMNKEARESLQRNLQLAERFGAEIVVLSGHDIAAEILSVARQRNITQIVLGKPLRPKWLDILQGSVVDDIIRGSSGMSVHVIAGESEPKEQRIKIRTAPGPTDYLCYLQVLMLVGLVTAVGVLGQEKLGITNIAMLFLVPIVYAASRFGIGASVFASLLSVFSFDFLFVPPTFRVTVSDIRYVITFMVFLLVGITTGTIAERLRFRIEESRTRENRTRALYNVAREMAAISDLEQVAERVVDYLSKTIDGEAVLFVAESAEDFRMLAASNPLSKMATSPSEYAVAARAYSHNQITGAGTDTLPGAYGVYLPLRTEQRTVGILGVKLNDEDSMTSDKRGLLEAVCGLVALAIGRLKLIAETQRMTNLEESERLRTALFNSISHDLRTPLSSIIGAATSLLEDGGVYDAGEKQTLLEAIKHGASRMNRIIANLLDIARLESGLMHLNLEWYDVQDAIGVALQQNEETIGQCRIIIHVDDNLPLVRMDYTLIEQVLANLIDNAVKYSPAQSELTIRATTGEHEITISLADRGQGIPAGDEEKIFDRYYRLQSAKHVSGTGLGLFICKTIIEAHGGKIQARRRTGGGSVVSFTLPATAEPPAVAQIDEVGEDQ